MKPIEKFSVGAMMDLVHWYGIIPDDYLETYSNTPGTTEEKNTVIWKLLREKQLNETN